MQEAPLFIGVLILVLRFLIERKPGARLGLPDTRERTLPEKLLTRSGQLLAIFVGVELYLTKNNLLTSVEAYWLNILPLLWLGLTIYRKDIPGDRSATNVGIWTLAPYGAYVSSSKVLPESSWLSLCLFGWAFFVGIWREGKQPA
jgi:hypothetical protein